MDSCPECRALADPATDAILRTARFAVHPVIGGGAVPGWLVVAPLRHVEAVDLLDPAEQAELGPLLARAGAALRAATPAAKLYVNVFAEVVPHLHVHLIARPPELPPERRGAKLFLDPARADPAEVARIAAAVRRELARATGPFERQP
jgi:diadenosine tetraphosphate (Ap4A) HIT family hydrolase